MTPKQKLITKVGAATAALLLSAVPVFEGTVLKTYRDPVDVLTSCSGHTGPELRMGQRWTPEQCQEQLTADLLKHADALKCIKTEMTDGQKAAFVSFAYNVGSGAFCGSTLARKANAGDMPGACAELSRWTFAGGKQLPGLVKRRQVERALCLAEDVSTEVEPLSSDIAKASTEVTTLSITEPQPVQSPWWRRVLDWLAFWRH